MAIAVDGDGRRLPSSIRSCFNLGTGSHSLTRGCHARFGQDFCALLEKIVDHPTDGFFISGNIAQTEDNSARRAHVQMLVFSCRSADQRRSSLCLAAAAEDDHAISIVRREIVKRDQYRRRVFEITYLLSRTEFCTMLRPATATSCPGALRFPSPAQYDRSEANIAMTIDSFRLQQRAAQILDKYFSH